jgi:RNA polymerase sigma-70 factor, ECF subfamily
LKGPTKGAEERDLVEAAQRDPRRFAALYECHFERVWAYVARRVPNRAEAEDLTAEVFHQALANLPKFEWRGAPFAAWLYRIAANALADHWQRATRERGNPLSDNPADPSAIDPEEIERRATLFRLIETLPRDQQRVIRMRFAEGKSIRDIALELGRTDGAVKQLQFRALEALRARMGKVHG